MKKPFVSANPIPPMSKHDKEFQEAFALHQRGQLDAAEKIYLSILKEEPKYFNALYAHGIVHLQREEFDRADRKFTLSIKLSPANGPLHNNRGNALLGLGRFEDAIQSYSKAISLQPDNHQAHYNRANAYAALKRYSEALQDYDRSLTMFPPNADAQNNRGSTLAKLYRFPEAVQSFDAALKINPAFASALGNRGSALANLGRLDEAKESLRRAIELQPNDANHHFSLAQVLKDQNLFEEALAACEKALALNPQIDYALGDRMFLKLRTCRWDQYESDTAAIIESVRNLLNVDPFIMLPLPSTAKEQKRCAETYVKHKFPPKKSLWRGERYVHDRIRGGYLSSDIREHPVAHLTAGMFETHDRSRFAITLFSTKAAEGNYRSRIANACEQFVAAESMGENELVALIRSSEIDILVDMNGYTANSRPGIMAARPAPVQVNYLGYPGTSGAGYIDYLVADRHIIPETAESAYAEKIVRLPSYQPNDSKRKISDAPQNRAGHGLPETGFVFCCFNNSYKITPQVFDIWMRLLAKVPDSVLWLVGNNSVQSNLRREAEHRNIAPERLVFAGFVPAIEDHLARYRLADLFLDTLPYTAHTTASDALWAGLPLITCLGDTFAARVSAGILHSVGMPELIVGSLEDYEQLALKLASDPELLRGIKTKLAGNRKTAPLFDTVRYTRHLEAAYARMHEIAQKGKSPHSFAVEPISE